MDWWPYVVGSLIVPIATQLLRAWKVADTYKAGTAFVVAVVVTGGGLVVTDQIGSWRDMVASFGVIFTGATVFYRTVLRPALALKGNGT